MDDRTVRPPARLVSQFPFPRDSAEDLLLDLAELRREQDADPDRA